MDERRPTQKHYQDEESKGLKKKKSFKGSRIRMTPDFTIATLKARRQWSIALKIQRQF